MSVPDVGRLGRVATFSAGIAKIPHLTSFLDAREIVLRPVRGFRLDAVVGWGRKPNTRGARRFAARHRLPFIQLEDGFLRSVELGVRGAPPCSIVVDPVGVYYDATRASRLEQLLAYEGPDDPLDDPALLARARRAIDAIRAAKLSKYNQARDESLGEKTKKRVLVVDQTASDLSVQLARPAPGGFEAMLEAARAEHPDAEIVVKTHPDVISGKRKGSLTDVNGVRLVGASNPASLLDEVDHVYVMSSLLGAEALLAGLPVTTFAVPFYAGWGLTDDRAAVPARRHRARTVEQLFAAAYMRYARYVDPETGAPCEVERIIEHLTLQRQVGTENPRRVVAVGFSAWKRAFVPSFVRGPGTTVKFAKDAAGAARHLTDDAVILVWGQKEHPQIRALAETRKTPIWRMEDGFLRSVGLGSDHFAPASLVVDARGIYYDPSVPSELEHLLATTDFDPPTLTRAEALREAIISARISKYNVGVRRHVGPPKRDPRSVVLAVGQVEDDASIQKGCLDVRTNEALLRAARAARPHAYLIYKPHPDVVSGNRQDALPLELAAKLCDEVVVDVTLPDCLAVADEVHTMTSLVGFEALTRGLRVVCYGQPFYAGWGLTEDRHPHPRRTRRLTLDELVAGTLLLYPRYVHPMSGAYTTPEAIVRSLAAATRPSAWESSWPGRQLRKIVNISRQVLRAP